MEKEIVFGEPGSIVYFMNNNKIYKGLIVTSRTSLRKALKESTTQDTEYTVKSPDQIQPVYLTEIYPSIDHLLLSLEKDCITRDLEKQKVSIPEWPF